MKHQAPSTNIQRNPKSKAPNQPECDTFLDIGGWNFSGAWMLVLGAFLTLTFTSCATRKSSVKPAFVVEHQTDRLVITHDSKPVAHFVFASTNILRPHFAHVHTPDGIQVTRNHPPIAGVDPVDHPTMHPGIWLAFGNISGQDFWRNKATIRHEKFITPPTTVSNQVTFVTSATLVSSNQTDLAKLESHFTIRSVQHSYLLFWKATFTPQTDTFTFGDQEEMGFGIRIATPLSEKNGGVIRNSDGLIGAKNAWGRTAAWCDYSGVLSNRLVGITVLTDPNNFRPSWMHSRDYGLIVANPFGQKAFTKTGDPSSVPVKKGETFTLHFGAYIHSSPTNEPRDLAAIYQSFENQN
jgi:hypothetical protein